MKSYIHAKGSYSESSNRSTLTEILSLIPDNSNKQVSPRDFRDALFSIWESSPIKFTYSGSSPYIGLDRPETKLKIFLGKKDIRGQAIMSIDLLNSDIDILLYNNKLDESECQDFKMSILAGIDKSLWKLAPTIEVKYKNNELNLIISNENGEIGLNSNKFVSINDIKWPSISDTKLMINNPSKIEDDDFGLFLVDNKFIHFKKTKSDPLDSLFSDENPTLVDIGGIKAGSTFKNIPISEIIRQILYPNLPPMIKIEFIGMGPNNSIERDHTNDTTIEYKATIIRRSEELKSNLIKVSNSKNTFIVKKGQVFESSGPSKFEYIDSIHIESSKISSNKSIGDFILEAEIKDIHDKSGSIKEKINFIYPYFYGFESLINLTPESTSILFGKLKKKIDTKSNQVIQAQGSGYFYFAYPKSYGEIKTDIDFQLISVKNVYSIENKWGSVEYNVYVSNDTISINGTPQIFKFEFI